MTFDLDIGQRRHDESKNHHGRLRNHKQLALVDVVRNNAADEREQQNGKRCSETDHAQPESRISGLKHEPSLGNRLHPGADVGKEVAGPEEAEVSMSQSAGKARNFNDSRFSRVSYGAMGESV